MVWCAEQLHAWLQRKTKDAFPFPCALCAADPDPSAPGQTHLHQADTVKIIGPGDGAGCCFCHPCQRGHNVLPRILLAALLPHKETATNCVLDAALRCQVLSKPRMHSNWQLRGGRGCSMQVLQAAPRV